MAFGAKVKLTVSDKGGAEFQKRIQQLADEATKKGITLKVKKIDASEAIESFRKDLEKMLSGLKISGLKEFLGTDGIEATYEKAAKRTEEAAKRMENAKKAYSAIGDVEKSLKSAFQRIGKLSEGNHTNNALSTYNELVESINKVRSGEQAATNEFVKGMQIRLGTLNNEITLQKEATKEAAQRTAAENKSSELAGDKARLTLLNQINSYMQNNTRAAIAFKGRFDDIIKELSNPNISKGALQEISTQFTGLKSVINSTGLSGKHLAQQLADAFSPTTIAKGAAFTKVLQGLRTLLNNIVAAVKEVDAAMVELKKVTDLSAASYVNYLKVASVTSQRIGATLANTVNATAEFARLGYTLEQSAAMGEAALVYQNVGDGIESVTEASESLISTIKAFGIEASEAMTIVDKFNEVGNRFAISSEGIGVALQKSASSLAAANNTLDQTIALATGMNAVVQNPEIVGTALKSVSMFLRAARVEVEETGESADGMANSVSDLRKQLLQLTNNKLDIMSDDKTFKSTYEIFKDLSVIWEDINDIDQSAILKLIGGKRNATAVTSLLTNFADAEAALATAQNSAGSALAENEKYLDSIAGRIDVMHAKFQTFATTVLDSGVVKAFINIAGSAADAGAALAEANVLLPIIAGTVTAMMHTVSRFKSGQSIGGIVSTFSEFGVDSDKVRELAIATQQLSGSEKVLLSQQLLRIEATGNINEATKNQIVDTLGLSAAMEKAKNASEGLTAGIKTLWVGMSTLQKVSLILTAISTVFSIVQAVFPEFGERIQRFFTPIEERIEGVRGELKELKTEINEVSNSYQKLHSSTSAILPRFVELAKGVNRFGENVSLTDDEYEEFLDLNNKVAELFPSLSAGIDENGNAILGLSYNADTLTDSLKALLEVERQLADQKIADGFEDAVKKTNNLVEDYDRQSQGLTHTLNLLTHAYREYADNDNVYYASVGHYLQQYIGDVELERSGERNVTDLRGINIGKQNVYEFVDSNGDKIDPEKIENAFTLAISNIEQQIRVKSAQIKATLDELNSYAVAWMQTTTLYKELDRDEQMIARNAVLNIDFEELGKMTEEEITEYISSSILTPLYNANGQVKQQIIDMFDLHDAFENNRLGAGEYLDQCRSIIEVLRQSNVSEEFIAAILGDPYKATEQLLNQVVNTVLHITSGKPHEKVITDANGESWIDFAKNLANLGYEDLEIMLGIISSPDSDLTIKEIWDLFFSRKKKVAEATVEITSEYKTSELDQSIESLLKYESILKSANEEMENGSLSASTLKDICELMADEQENYLDYLEITNGELKLNVDLWKQKSLATIEADKAHTEAEIERIKTENIELNKQLATTIAITKIRSDLQNRAKHIDGDSVIVDSLMDQISGNDATISELEKLLIAYQNLIDNFGKSSSSSSTSEYFAEFSDYYALEKDLTHIQERRADKERQLNNTDDLLKKVSYEKELRDIYVEEQKAVEALIKARSYDIDQNISKLQSQGFDIFYNREAGEFVVRNIEHINDLTAENREETEKLITATDELVAANVESTNTFDELSISIGNTTTNITQYLKEMSDGYVDSLEETTSAFETLVSAVRSFNENGYLTVETYESIISLGSKYLGMLDVENGEIKLNEEAFRALTEAKINDLAVTQARSLLDTIKENKDNTEALWELAGAYDDLGDSIWETIYAELAMLNLDEELENSFINQFEAIQALANSAISGLNQSMSISASTGKTAADLYQEQSDALDDILDKTMELIQYETEQRIEAIEKQVESYQKIVDLKKESLKQSKDEEDYEENIAEKVSKIAELQAKIDKLALDDSRAAFAERTSLTEELEKAQKDLADYQSDYAYNKQTESLDKMAEAYEQEKQTEIDILNDSISSTEKIYQLAIQRIQNNWDSLFYDIISWNYQAGNTIQSEIVNSWNLASQAVREYGSYVQAVNQLDIFTSGTAYGNTIGNFSGGIPIVPAVDGDAEIIYDNPHDIIVEAPVESAFEEIEYASLLSSFGARSGINPQQAATILSNAGGVGSSAFAQSIAKQVYNESANNINDSSSLFFNPSISVVIGDGGNGNAETYGKQIAQTTIDQLYSAFERKGISNTLAVLKP